MKLINSKGETIVETLAAILIVAVCFIMIQTSVVTAARINKTASEQNVPFNNDGASELSGTSCSISVIIDSSINYSNNSKCYKTSEEQGGYYYYE